MNKWVYALGFIFLTPNIFCAERKARDPFFLSRTVEQKEKKKNSFYIVGMVQHHSSQGVLVQHGDKQRMMFIGDVIDGYTLSLITKNYAEFSKKNKTKRIEIR